MIRAVESNKRSDADNKKSKISSYRVKKHKHYVRKEYNNEENPLLFVGFLLLILAAFIIMAIVKFADRTNNMTNNNVKPDIETKSEIIKIKDSDDKETRTNAPKHKTRSYNTQ